MEEVLLSDEFFLYPAKEAVHISLSNSCITIEYIPTGAKFKSEVISVADITGCQIVKGNKTTVAKWFLSIFSYSLHKTKLKGCIRRRITRSFGVASAKSNDEIKQCVVKWKRAIKYLISGKKLSKNEVHDLSDPIRRNFLVYINPFSGQGKSMQIYAKTVKPMFAEAEIEHKVVETEYAGHARKMIKLLKLDAYDGIVIVSGDGLIHEVINGLMERDDWREAIKTPLGIVPGGSGNALAATIVYSSTGMHCSNDIVCDAVFEIVRGKTCDLSLCYAEVDDKQFYSFLNFAWGFFADVDIESEQYRALGYARFTVGCVVRLVNLRKYHGKLSYLPADHHHLHELFKYRAKSNQISNSPTKSPSLSPNNNSSLPILTANDLSEVPGTSFGHCGINASLKISSNCESIEKTVKRSEIQAMPVVPATMQENCTQISDLDNRPFYVETPLSQPLPSEWKLLEDEFIFISPAFLSHFGSDMFVMPCAKMDEPVMYVYCVKATVSKIDLMKILLNISNGSHLSMFPRDTLVIPCRAFRLEPFSCHTGYMTADGELIPHKPLQASVTNIKAKVLCSAPPNSTSM